MPSSSTTRPTTDVNLGGWFLTDDFTNALKFRIPNGTIIRAGGYLVFDEDDFNPTPAAAELRLQFERATRSILFSGDRGNQPDRLHPRLRLRRGRDRRVASAATSPALGEEHFVAQAP